jgi:hypothetical protein
VDELSRPSLPHPLAVKRNRRIPAFIIRTLAFHRKLHESLFYWHHCMHGVHGVGHNFEVEFAETCRYLAKDAKAVRAHR